MKNLGEASTNFPESQELALFVNAEKYTFALFFSFPPAAHLCWSFHSIPAFYFFLIECFRQSPTMALLIRSMLTSVMFCHLSFPVL